MGKRVPQAKTIAKLKAFLSAETRRAAMAAGIFNPG
jgi:hypothetical protein